jgi:hypothetical protein
MRETTAAAVNAAVNPDGARTAALDPLADIPIAVKVAVPSAAPTWVAEPAIPEARPVCVSGIAAAMTMVVREAERDTRGDQQQAGENRDRVSGPARSVRQPQVSGGENHEPDDEGAPRPQHAEHPREECE